MEKVLRIVKKIIPARIFSVFQPVYHLALAWWASLVYGWPSQNLTVIGVTGTNGKTTVVHLLHEIFIAAGFKVGSVSSLRLKIGGEEEKNLLKMTMPGRFRLQKFLSDCVKAGCRFAILEVTSEGIKQSRHRFIRFQAAVLTNIRPEHIEAHGGFDNYRKAKLQLFKNLAPSGFAVLNREDEFSEEIAKETAAHTIVWYSRSSIDLNRIGHPVRLAVSKDYETMFEIDGAFMASALRGEFNFMNILAASAAAMAEGVSLSAIAQALAVFGGVAGRMEYIEKEPFAVVADYAHTPDALEKVYQTLLEAKLPSGLSGGGYPVSSKLICVLGAAGGGRDKWKRPEMGRVASRFCQRIILTSEDPDDEDPAVIAIEIAAGISNFQFPISKILDRREAVREALKMAKPGDTVIITGMGAQPWFIAKGEKIPWDDREVAREELAKVISISE